MAKLRRLDGEGFEIWLPQPGVSYPTDSMGRIQVQVKNLDFNSGFVATICTFGSGSGSGASNTNLVQEGSSAFWSAYVPAGSVPATAPTSPNKTVYIQAYKGTAASYFHSQDFGAYSGGAGVQLFLTSAHPCNFCQPGQPVPVALILQLDGRVASGSCTRCDVLNQPTRLLHTADPGYPCCWFSNPLDFCPDSESPGFWQLQKTDPSTWSLLLRQGNSEVVAYNLTTPAAMDCSFPIVLRLVRAGGECTNWPPTVTLSPAR